MLMTPPPYYAPNTVNRQQISTQAVPGIQGAPVLRPGVTGLKGLPSLGGMSGMGAGSQMGGNPMGGGGMGNPLNQGQNPMMANLLRG